jgi:hypothetical protein
VLQNSSPAHIPGFKCRVTDGQQLFGLLAGQPVAQPGALLANVGDVGQAGGLFGPEHSVLPRLRDQLPHRGEP